MSHSLFAALYLFSTLAKIVSFDLTNDCVSWSQVPKQQCCSCDNSADLVCTHNCPLGYFEVGNFLIRNGKPSTCLLDLTSERLSVSSNEEEISQNARAVLCGPCSINCRRCNGPTNQHCTECSYNSYKNVVDEPVEYFDSGPREIIASNRPPDGNIIEHQETSVNHFRNKRSPRMSQGQVIGKSIYFNTSQGISGYVSWKIPYSKVAPFEKIGSRSRRIAKLRRRRFATGVARTSTQSSISLEPKPADTSRTYPIVKPTGLAPKNEADVEHTASLIRRSTLMKSTTVASTAQSSTSTTQTTFTAARTSSAKPTTLKLTTSRANSTSIETTIVHSTFPSAEFTTKQKATTTLGPTPSTEETSIFYSFTKSQKKLRMWFECVSSCPIGKYIVKETRCRKCSNSECVGGRECFVTNVHNVCVQTCQPGFVKHSGLMVCQCLGPVVNQTCTQPVHTSPSEQLPDEYSTAITNLTIVIPVLICLLAIFAMLVFICLKRRLPAEPDPKRKGILSSMATNDSRRSRTAPCCGRR